MPYKDPDKQRAANRAHMQRKRARPTDNDEIVGLLTDIRYLLIDVREAVAHAAGLEIEEDGFHTNPWNPVEPMWNPVEPEIADDSAVLQDSHIVSNGKGSTYSVEPMEKQEVMSSPLYNNESKSRDSSSIGIKDSSTTTISTTTNGVDKQRDVGERIASARSLIATGTSTVPEASVMKPLAGCPYESTLGDPVIREMAQKMVKFDDAMGSTSYIKKLLRNAYETVGDAGNDERLLREAIKRLFRALEAKRDTIKTPAGWARVTFVSTLQEVVDDAE